MVCGGTILLLYKAALINDRLETVYCFEYFSEPTLAREVSTVELLFVMLIRSVL